MDAGVVLPHERRRGMPVLHEDVDSADDGSAVSDARHADVTPVTVPTRGDSSAFTDDSDDVFYSDDEAVGLPAPVAAAGSGGYGRSDAGGRGDVGMAVGASAAAGGVSKPVAKAASPVHKVMHHYLTVGNRW